MSRTELHNTIHRPSRRPPLPFVRIGPEEGEPLMPITKYSVNFPYAREELLVLFACAQAGDVEHGGRYDSRGGVLYIWSHPWSVPALRDESTLVGSFYFDWLTDRLVHIEWDEGFEFADL